MPTLTTSWERPCFGVGGDEAIHCILDVMSAKAPYTTLSRTMAYSSDGQRGD